MPLPLSPLLPFSLSPVRLYRNRDPDPRIPHPTDNGNLSTLYLIRNPLMEFGGIVPFIGKTGSPSSTPISCPDILLSLDLITRASDALEVSSIHIIIFHKIIFIFLDLFFSMCSFPPILGLKFQVSDVFGLHRSTRQYWLLIFDSFSFSLLFFRKFTLRACTIAFIFIYELIYLLIRLNIDLSIWFLRLLILPLSSSFNHHESVNVTNLLISLNLYFSIHIFHLY